MIPGDGTVIEGIASVDESAITGESAPVIREAGGDRSAVTGGTRVLSDRIVVEITQEPGKSFLDRMIALVEGAERRKTPNEIALNILLAGLTLVFLIVVVTLRPFAEFSATERLRRDADRAARGPDPDHDRGAALGDRDRRHGPARPPQRARPLRPRGRGLRRRRRAAARQDRDDHPRQPRGDRVRARCPASSEAELAEAAQVSSLADETPEGRSIVVLAKQYGIREHEFAEHEANFVPFTAETRMSGVDLNGQRLRKGAGDAIVGWVEPPGRPGARGAPGRAGSDRQRGRHAARRRPGQPGARRDLPQGRGQGGHGRSASTSSGRWGSAR